MFIFNLICITHEKEPILDKGVLKFEKLQKSIMETESDRSYPTNAGAGYKICSTAIYRYKRYAEKFSHKLKKSRKYL